MPDINVRWFHFSFDHIDVCFNDELGFNLLFVVIDSRLTAEIKRRFRFVARHDVVGDTLCLHVYALGGGEDVLIIFIYVNMDAWTACTFRSFP